MKRNKEYQRKIEPKGDCVVEDKRDLTWDIGVILYFVLSA